MTNGAQEITDKLVSRQIKPSVHRMKVLEYLINNQNHPTVEQIFTRLKSEVPTLSKATIYNTLNAFVDAHLARVITIEDHETRYDHIIEDHGHFKCESCGAIFDFAISLDSITAAELDDFVINDKNVYFKGLCSRCRYKNQTDILKGECICKQTPSKV